MSAEQTGESTLTVMVYSDDRTTREQIRMALGKRVAADLPVLDIVEAATAPAVLTEIKNKSIDLLILDGEAQPYGGLGVCHQVKDEFENTPPVVLLVGRRDDAWLASWSQADAVSTHPVDPVRLPEIVAGVIRTQVLA